MLLNFILLKELIRFQAFFSSFKYIMNKKIKKYKFIFYI